MPLVEGKKNKGKLLQFETKEYPSWKSKITYFLK